MRVFPGIQMMYEVPASVLKELYDLRAEVARLREALREAEAPIGSCDCVICSPLIAALGDTGKGTCPYGCSSNDNANTPCPHCDPAALSEGETA